jgi:hypothetical protein
MFGFVARALDYGGLVFEDDKPDTLAEALAALERGLAEYLMVSLDCCQIDTRSDFQAARSPSAEKSALRQSAEKAGILNTGNNPGTPPSISRGRGSNWRSNPQSEECAESPSRKRRSHERPCQEDQRILADLGESHRQNVYSAPDENTGKTGVGTVKITLALSVSPPQV